MFSNAMVYKIHYFAVGADGRRGPLSEKALQSLPFLIPHHYLGPSERIRVNARGENIVLRDLPRLPSYLCERLSGEGFRKTIVTIDYRNAGEESLTHREFEAACREDV